MVAFVGILPAACRNDQNEFGNENRVPRTPVVVYVSCHYYSWIKGQGRLTVAGDVVVVEGVWYSLGTESVH